MTACSGCELLPAALPITGQLFLWPPLGHTREKLEASLLVEGLQVSEPAPDCLAVSLSAEVFELARSKWSELLSRAEQDDCKCLILPVGATPSLGDMAQVTSLTTLLGKLAGRWLVEMLGEHRLTTHFQPIVRTNNPSEIYAHECLVRGLDRSGKLVGPGVLYDAAKASKLLFHLDRACRLQHIKAARKEQLDTAIFINFNPTSIYDPAFCLRTTVAAIESSPIAKSQFVFEVVESDHVDDPARLPRILNFYREAGFRVALDDLGAGYSSLNMLSQLRPDFVKLDMQLIRGVDKDPYKATIVSKLLEVARAVGVQTVAEGIETEGEWRWAVENGADFTQGYYFAKPTAIAARSINVPHVEACYA